LPCLQPSPTRRSSELAGAAAAAQAGVLDDVDQARGLLVDRVPPRLVAVVLRVRREGPGLLGVPDVRQDRSQHGALAHDSSSSDACSGASPAPDGAAVASSDGSCAGAGWSIASVFSASVSAAVVGSCSALEPTSPTGSVPACSTAASG